MSHDPHDCFRNLLALLELEAINADKKIPIEVKNRRYARAFVEQMWATKLRELAMKVEADWKQEQERDA